MSENILVVEDEDRIRKLLVLYLSKEGYQVDEANNGESAYRKIKNKDYSCILMDINLPGMNGDELLEKIRTIKSTPIIMVSAQSEEKTRISAFELGADDYVTKPFSPREVVLRVKAILQRLKNSIYSPEFNVKEVLVYGDLIIDANSRRLIVGEADVECAPKEFELLLFLARYPEKAFSRKELLKSVWNSDASGDLRTVDTHIKKIRKKLDKHSNNLSRVVVTVWGTGYMFDSSKI